MDPRWIQKSIMSAVSESPRDVTRAVGELLEICYEGENRTILCVSKWPCEEVMT